MKAYQRRATGQETFYNLDCWNPSIGCWSKTPRQYQSESQARQAAKQPGRYRISKSDGTTRTEMEPFVIGVTERAGLSRPLARCGARSAVAMASDLDREVAEHVEATRREPLPGQAELPTKPAAPDAAERI